MIVETNPLLIKVKKAAKEYRKLHPDLCHGQCLNAIAKTLGFKSFTSLAVQVRKGDFVYVA